MFSLSSLECFSVSTTALHLALFHGPPVTITDCLIKTLNLLVGKHSSFPLSFKS